MQLLNRIIPRNSPSLHSSRATIWNLFRNPRGFSSDSKIDKETLNSSWSTESSDGIGKSASFSWNESDSSWSTGLTKDQFDGEVIGLRRNVGDGGGGGSSGGGDGGGGGGWRNEESGEYKASEEDLLKNRFEELKREARASMARMKRDVDDDEKMRESLTLWRQITKPGTRGAPLKDSEKAEIYRLHKENPEVYTVERLAKDFRIMRQRVVAILWLKEDEEKEEKKRGMPLDDSVERLIDSNPEFFISYDREYHVASLPRKPDFKVMPEGWDGTPRDPDEVLYEISKKEDDMLYEEFLQRFKFNTMKYKGEVKVHRYSRRRPSDGWEFTIEKLGTRAKRGLGGGWKFVSQPDGSTRPLNETEKIYVKRETPRHRRKILP